MKYLNLKVFKHSRQLKMRDNMLLKRDGFIRNMTMNPRGIKLKPDYVSEEIKKRTQRISEWILLQLTKIV